MTIKEKLSIKCCRYNYYYFYHHHNWVLLTCWSRCAAYTHMAATPVLLEIVHLRAVGGMNLPLLMRYTQNVIMKYKEVNLFYELLSGNEENYMYNLPLLYELL